MKSIEQMIFETRFKGEEFDANDYNDWAKENEWEAYTICLSIAKQLLQHGVMQAEASAGAEGAAVGNSAAGKGVSGGIISCPSCGQGWDLTKHNACSCGAQLRGELLRGSL
jgi:hypothetical protein